MRKVLLLMAALGALALTVPAGVLATHKPDHNPGGGGGGGGGGGQATITASPNPVVYGSATTISGRLQNVPAGTQVALEENPYPFNGAFREIATTTVAANGDYRFTARPTVNTRYRVQVKTAPPTTTPEVTVQVAIRLSFGVSDSTPRAGQRIRFSGSAVPEHDGKTVYIQRRTSTGAYRSVARTRLRDAGSARSTYSRRLRVYRDGVYRARILADEDHAAGRSSLRRIDVH